MLFACLGVLGAVLTAVVGLMTLGGGVLAVGIWKGGIDNRVTAVETASKEQIGALKESTAKQIDAVAAASKTMVEGLEKTTDKRLSDIEHDRNEKIAEAARWRTQQESTVTKLDTLITGQQKQIDTLTEIANRPRKP